MSHDHSRLLGTRHIERILTPLFHLCFVTSDREQLFLYIASRLLLFSARHSLSCSPYLSPLPPPLSFLFLNYDSFALTCQVGDFITQMIKKNPLEFSELWRLFSSSSLQEFKVVHFEIFLILKSKSNMYEGDRKVKSNFQYDKTY